MRGSRAIRSKRSITVDSWRWVEHAGWVIFEDVFLILSCFHSLREMRSVAEFDMTDPQPFVTITL